MKNLLTLVIMLFSFAQSYAEKSPSVEIHLGKKGASHTIIEYTSLTCNHCADFHLYVVPKIKDKHIKTNKVYLIIRPFIMDKVSLIAFKLVHSLPREKRERALTKLFSTQMLWIEKKPEEIGKIIGLTPQQTKAALADKNLEDALLTTAYKATQEHKIDATPTFLFGPEKVEGALTIEEFETHLKQKKQKKS